MPTYATPDDLTDPPENAEDVILLASALVTEATMTAFYSVDADGVPTDEDTRTRFKAATIAQVNHWTGLGIDPTQGVAGLTDERRVSTKSIGSASVSYDFRGMQDNVEARAEALHTLAPMAVAILGHLMRGPVIVHG